MSDVPPRDRHTVPARFVAVLAERADELLGCVTILGDRGYRLRWIDQGTPSGGQGRPTACTRNHTSPPRFFLSCVASPRFDERIPRFTPSQPISPKSRPYSILGQRFITTS